MKWKPILITQAAGEDAQIWRKLYDNLEYKCIFNHPDYIKVIAANSGGEAELFFFGDQNGHYIYYPYVLNKIDNIESHLHSGDTEKFDEWYDITSSWYYGGPQLNQTPFPSELVYGFHTAFHEYCQKRGVVSEFIRCDPLTDNHNLFPSDSAQYNRDTVYVDLTRPREEIYRTFVKGNKWLIRKAHKGGYRIQEADARNQENWSLFYDIYNKEMTRKDAPTHLRFSFDFFLKLHEAIPNNLCLLHVKKDDQYIGGAIVVYELDCAIYHLSATDPEHWKSGVNNLLFSEAIFWAQDKGCKIMDFMGGRPGVFDFKTRFSKLRDKFYTIKIVHNRTVFDNLSRLWDPTHNASQSDFFPPYRKPKENT